MQWFLTNLHPIQSLNVDNDMENSTAWLEKEFLGRLYACAPALPFYIQGSGILNLGLTYFFKQFHCAWAPKKNGEDKIQRPAIHSGVSGYFSAYFIWVRERDELRLPRWL